MADLATVRSTGQRLPNRMILHGVEGVGKTSFAAQAPLPLFLMARGETGLETLIDAGQLPPVAHMPEITSWPAFLSTLRTVREAPHSYRTLVLDALNGFERLCHEYVCQTAFNGDWTETGFIGYMRGYEVSLSEWREALNLLDRIREERKMSILCIAHTAIKPFRNPEGNDFDRYAVDLHHKTWALTHKWADMVLFANFFIDTKKDASGNVKGIGTQERVLYAVRHAAFDAKNRHGLPEEISMGKNATEAWANFSAALKAARAAGLQPTAPEGSES